MVCDQWSNFETFLKDTGPAPSKKHTLDRINVNGNYEPGNVCWSSYRHQSLNRRNSKQLDVGQSSGFLSFGV